MVESDEAAVKFLVPNQELTKAAEPTVRHLDNPASGLLGGFALELTRFLSTAFDVRDVAMCFNDFERGFAAVARVGAQVLVAPLRWINPFDHGGLKHRLQLRHIMAVGSEVAQQIQTAV